MTDEHDEDFLADLKLTEDVAIEAQNIAFERRRKPGRRSRDVNIRQVRADLDLPDEVPDDEVADLIDPGGIDYDDYDLSTDVEP